MNNAPHKKEIDAWLAEREAAAKADKVSHEMNPVAWHLEQITGIPCDKITHSDCCYFVTRVGGDYLEKKLRGVGRTIARRLCLAAEEWRKGQAK